MNINRFTRALYDLDTAWWFEDFKTYLTATQGVSSFVNAGTVVASAARNGILTLTTGAVINQEAGVTQTNAQYLPLAGKPIYGRGLVQFTEANVNNLNAFVGFSSAPAAALLIDASAGVRASGMLCGFYKQGGTTVWQAVTRNGSTVTTTTSATTAGGAAFTDLEIQLNDWDGVNMQASFKADGAYLKDTNGLPIRHLLPIAAATLMAMCADVKSGSASSEVLLVDWLYAAQAR